MSSNATHFTKIFPKRADITGSPTQAFYMQDSRNKYFKYLIVPLEVLSNTSTHPRSVMI